ncbi:hypothetical protein Acr_20g0005920 [Actinidia rufa]|uniref:Retrotransposon gag domain-containing protein n=1 Tax=Actinidia rufa TaxID=165716 RepID=A0A7J0GDD6_9ERIC|nr:hypothetical protein Acr_20g0005920 [Actinidia rufa]
MMEQIRIVSENMANMQQTQQIFMETLLAMQYHLNSIPVGPPSSRQGMETTRGGSQGGTVNEEGIPLSSASSFDLRPPYPLEKANIPYLEGACGPKFKSVSVSVPSWEDLVKMFHDKIFYMEERPTTLHLMRVTQRSSKDILHYVKCFREKDVDVQGPVGENQLVKMCFEGTQPQYKVHLVNHTFDDFSRLCTVARNLSETVRLTPQAPPPLPKYNSWRQSPRRGATAYVAKGSSGNSWQNENKKFDEPPPLPMTVKKAKVLLDAWVEDGKIFLPEVTKRTDEIQLCLLWPPTRECWALQSLDEGKHHACMLSRYEEQEEPSVVEIADQPLINCAYPNERRTKAL